MKEAAKSGMSRRDWARSVGVDARSLNCWRVALERRGKTRPVRLVELVAAPQPERCARFVVRAGEFSVEVDDNFDEVALRRLLRVVAQC